MKEQSTFKKTILGVSLIEVLVTIVIMAIGLLGLAGLQMRLQSSEVESYQRTQALMLLEDMSNRIAGNRNNAADYIGGTLGTGDGQPDNCAGLIGQALDTCEWSNALKGAAETSGGANVGAMIGARGCITDPTGAGNQFMITVVWQGMTPIAAPSSNCGVGLYDSAPGEGNCANDLCRRSISTSVRVANLAS